MSALTSNLMAHVPPTPTPKVVATDATAAAYAVRALPVPSRVARARAATHDPSSRPSRTGAPVVTTLPLPVHSKVPVAVLPVSLSPRCQRCGNGNGEPRETPIDDCDHVCQLCSGLAQPLPLPPVPDAAADDKGPTAAAPPPPEPARMPWDSPRTKAPPTFGEIIEAIKKEERLAAAKAAAAPQ